MKVRKFEDLECWQKARELCKCIYQLSRKAQFKKDFKHADQINGSVGSSMDNIAEGFGRRGNKEFAYFLHISLGSVYEVKSQLYRASDKDYITIQEFRYAMELADVTASKVFNLIRAIEKSDFMGPKYK
jgi:four helix bundle protein